MKVTEHPLFVKVIEQLLDHENQCLLIDFLIEHPDKGDLIPGGKGLRKIRWSVSGRGKRGGARIIYYWHVYDDEILLLYGYAKSRRSDLTHEQLKTLIALLNEQYR